MDKHAATSEPPDRTDLERIAAGIDLLPCLTRTVFLLHRWDGHSYEDIARRCGISVDEVTIRMAAALFGVRRYCDGDRMLRARIRQAFRPWRFAWYAWRSRRMDRRLGL